MQSIGKKDRVPASFSKVLTSLELIRGCGVNPERGHLQAFGSVVCLANNDDSIYYDPRIVIKKPTIVICV